MKHLEVHSGDDIRGVLTADFLNGIIRDLNRGGSASRPLPYQANPCIVRVLNNAGQVNVGMRVQLSVIQSEGARSDIPVLTDRFFTYEPLNNANTELVGFALDFSDYRRTGCTTFRAAVAGVCLALVNVHSPSHRYATYGNRSVLRSTTDSNAPYLLLHAPGTGDSQLCLIYIRPAISLRNYGEFDSDIVYIDGAPVLRCHDSGTAAVPGDPLSPSDWAGIVSAGSFQWKVPRKDFNITGQGTGFLYLKVEYLGLSDAVSSEAIPTADNFSVDICFDNSPPAGSETVFIERLATVVESDQLPASTQDYRISSRRTPGNVRITDRWLV